MSDQISKPEEPNLPGAPPVEPKPKKQYSEAEIERRRKLEQAFAIRGSDPHFRQLALPPLYEVTPQMSLEEFDRLCRIVWESRSLPDVQPYPRKDSAAETIVRACLLLFALVESGGLCLPHPEREIGKLKIDPEAAALGYLRWAAVDDESKKVAALGPRQHLSALGRIHLQTFVYYRRKKGGAVRGDFLLPALPETLRELKAETIKFLPWLKKLTGKVTWENIFNLWLNQQIGEIRNDTEETGSITWQNTVDLALWRILQRERHVLLVAARSRRIRTAPLPEKRLRELLEDASQSVFAGKSRGEMPEDEDLSEISQETVPENADETAADTGAESERGENSEGALLPGVLADKSVRRSVSETAFSSVSQWLVTLRAEKVNRAEAVAAARALIDSAELEAETAKDLRDLLLWSAHLLETEKKRFSTVYTYAGRITRAFYAVPDKAFNQWQTEDVADFLEGYEMPNTINNARNTLRAFDKFQNGESPGLLGRINWRKHSLRASEIFRERDILRESEYGQVRDAVHRNDSLTPVERARKLALLTLLRRCGLRVIEAAYLTPACFFNLTEWQLSVLRSKTRAGRGRLLPLYYLLDEAEFRQLREFVKQRFEEGGRDAPLFIQSDGITITLAAQLGRETEQMLRAAGFAGETAHGLRHGFATAIFSAWWLLLTAEKGEGDDKENGEENGFRLVLREFARPEVEGRAVAHASQIALLMGHADARVSFDRYIHTLDLASADAIRRFESQSPELSKEGFKNAVAFRLLSTDSRSLDSILNEKKIQPKSFVPWQTMEEIALDRLKNL